MLPDFGVQGVLDRFGQIEPKVLITIDGYRYNGKPIDVRPKLVEIVGRLPTLEHVVLTPFLDPAAQPGPLARAVPWDDFVVPDPGPIPFAQLPFDHPIYILYSSGTTGVPKAIVHGAGGTLLQHLKELLLHTDLKPRIAFLFHHLRLDDVELAGQRARDRGHPGGVRRLAVPSRRQPAVRPGAAGPGHRLRHQRQVHRRREEGGARAGRTHDLSALRAILSTGSPLVAESFDFVYRSIKEDLHLASISGGTDIVSCFALGNPIAPVWRGELQTRGLGMAVEVWNEQGEPVVGEPGELVCVKPFPSMPVGFWNDPDGRRYRSAYFERFPGVWTHGDHVELTPHDGLIIYGRSDAVLNPGGVRIGTAEIYRQVEQVPEVVEALAVGQEWDGDQRVVLFVRLAEGAAFDNALVERIRRQIRTNCTPRHVPAKILPIADIPRTMNNKIAELAVREVIHGRAVRNVDALANPQSLELYRDLHELTT